MITFLSTIYHFYIMWHLIFTWIQCQMYLFMTHNIIEYFLFDSFKSLLCVKVYSWEQNFLKWLVLQNCAKIIFLQMWFTVQSWTKLCPLDLENVKQFIVSANFEIQYIDTSWEYTGWVELGSGENYLAELCPVDFKNFKQFPPIISINIDILNWIWNVSWEYAGQDTILLL